MEDREGWVKIHRKILDSEVFLYDDTAWKVFMVCMMLANSQTGTFTVGSRQLGRYTNLEHTVAFRALKRLEQKYKMVQRETQRDFTSVSICNWQKYQDKAQRTTQRQRNADATPTQPLQEVEVEVEDTNVSLTPLPPMGEESKKLWACWEEHLAPITRNQAFHRNALLRLSKAHGSEQVIKMIRLAAAAHSEKFAPKEAKPANPKQLEERWDALVLWGKGHFQKQQHNRIMEIS